MDCDYENPIYDYTTVSGRTRRAFKRLTWKNLAWGIPAVVLIFLALILITTNSTHNESNGLDNSGVTLLLPEPEPASSNNETNEACDEEQTLADEWDLNQAIKNCLNPKIKLLLKAISIASRIEEMSDQKQHTNKTWTKENIVKPVCLFLNSIQCSKKEDFPKNESCANNETLPNFETYIESLSNTVCGSNTEQLLALLESGGEGCSTEFPTKVAECINNEFNDPFEDVKESASNRSCGTVIRVHQCLTQGAIDCGGQAPQTFQFVTNGVQLWIGNKCLKDLKISSETSPTEKPEFLPESASMENEIASNLTHV